MFYLPGLSLSMEKKEDSWDSRLLHRESKALLFAKSCAPTLAFSERPIPKAWNMTLCWLPWETLFVVFLWFLSLTLPFYFHRELASISFNQLRVDWTHCNEPLWNRKPGVCHVGFVQLGLHSYVQGSWAMFLKYTPILNHLHLSILWFTADTGAHLYFSW